MLQAFLLSICLLSDHGESLSNVIQTTISPRSWKIKGGSSSIYYHKPKKSLIIRTTEENHEQIRELLEQLRR